MSPLNDDELNSLLEQAKSMQPQPSSELRTRALNAYRKSVAAHKSSRAFLLRPIRIPLPLGMLAAVLLLVIGALCGRTFPGPYVIARTHSVDEPITRERVVYRDCSTGEQEPKPQAGSLFAEFKPVRQIRPRVLGSNSR